MLHSDTNYSYPSYCESHWGMLESSDRSRFLSFPVPISLRLELNRNKKTISWQILSLRPITVAGWKQKRSDRTLHNSPAQSVRNDLFSADGSLLASHGSWCLPTLMWAKMTAQYPSWDYRYHLTFHIFGWKWKLMISLSYSLFDSLAGISLIQQCQFRNS